MIPQANFIHREYNLLVDNLRRMIRLNRSATVSSNSLCIEIGPLDRPLLTKDLCKVIYIDHISDHELREKYREDGSVDCSKIEPIDFVWNGSLLPLSDLHKNYELIVACHVIEHVPNFVGFLLESEELLSSDGRIFLVIPDKQYTFDFLRKETSIDQVLAAHMTKRVRPNLDQILDELIHSSNHSIEMGWGTEETTSKLSYTRSLNSAYSVACDIFNRDDYFDCHCWVFTETNFFQIMKNLNDLEILKIGYLDHTSTQSGEFEFSVTLKKFHTFQEASKSWEDLNTN